jgi:hypothetical protein
MQPQPSEIDVTPHQPPSPTLKALLEQWGVLLTYESLGKVMARSPDGLRLTLAQNTSDWAQRVNAAKVKIGRRVLFRTCEIAALIDDGSPLSAIGIFRPLRSRRNQATRRPVKATAESA